MWVQEHRWLPAVEFLIPNQGLTMGNRTKSKLSHKLSIFEIFLRHRSAMMAVIASFFFATSTFLSKILGGGYLGDAIHPLQITHGRFAFGFLGTVIILILFSKNRLTRPHFSLHLGRVMLGWIGVSIMFNAIIYIPAPDAIALTFMSPIFAMLFSIFLLRENVEKQRWLAAACAFIGVIFLLRPNSWHISPIAFFCLIAAAAFGLEIICIKSLTKRERPIQILLFSNAIGAVIASLPLFYIATRPSLSQWFGLISVGFLMVIGQTFFLFAIQKSEASMVSPYIYATLIFVVFFDLVFLGTKPDLNSIFGGLVIVAACIYMSYRESVIKKT